MNQQARPADPDLMKGAIEGPPVDDQVDGNPNAPGLDENGLPNGAELQLGQGQTNG